MKILKVGKPLGLPRTTLAIINKGTLIRYIVANETHYFMEDESFEPPVDSEFWKLKNPINGLVKIVNKRFICSIESTHFLYSEHIFYTNDILYYSIIALKPGYDKYEMQIPKVTGQRTGKDYDPMGKEEYKIIQNLQVKLE